MNLNINQQSLINLFKIKRMKISQVFLDSKLFKFLWINEIIGLVLDS